MTLKINYLDKKNYSYKNRAIFVSSDLKTSMFKGKMEDKINKKIINFLKSNKSLKKNKIISINEDFDQKIIVIYLTKRIGELDSEKLGAKLYDFVKNNEINHIYIEAPLDKKLINFDSFIHGAELKSYEFNLYKTTKDKIKIDFIVDKKK